MAQRLGSLAVVAGFPGRERTDIIKASGGRERSHLAHRDGPVMSNKVQGCANIQLLHRDNRCTT